MLRDRSTLSLTVAILLSVLTPVGARAGAPLPYELIVDVSYGSSGGPEALRARLERQVHRELADSACFEAVRREPTPGRTAVWLQLIVEHVEEGTHYDISLAQRTTSQLPPSDQARLKTAVIEGNAYLNVRREPAATPFREKRLNVVSRHRPISLEDPREYARNEWLYDLTRATRSFACKGSPKKWARWMSE